MLLRGLMASGAGGPGATTTMNPSDKSSDLSLSSGDLTVTRGPAANAWRSVRSTTSRNTGKVYFEVFVLESAGQVAGHCAGLMVSTDSLSQVIGWNTQNANDCGLLYLNSPNVVKIQNSTTGTAVTGYGRAVEGEYIHVAVDFDAGQCWFRRSGGTGWAGGGDPAAGTTPTLTFAAGTTMFAAASLHFSTQAVRFNFGQAALNGSIPTGFSVWG